MTQPRGSAPLMRGGKPEAVRDQAEALAATLPPLLVAAERLAASVSLGVHGRRKAGMGETFWQFRRYQTRRPVHRHRLAAIGQIAASLRARARMGSGRSGVVLARRLARHALQIRNGRRRSKIDRASVLTLALAALLVRGGERIALLGDGHGPGTGRAPLRRIAHELIDVRARRHRAAARRAA